MTNKEAIKFLQQLHPNGGHCWLDEQRIEAIGMAIKVLQKEPVSEIDFEQELYKYFGQVKDFTLGMRIAKRFYEIGRNYQEPISEDLEEASLLYYPKMSRISEPHGIIPADNRTHYLGDANEDNRKAFKTGANWQEQKDESYTKSMYKVGINTGKELMKQQMMAKAVDGLVVCNNFTHGYKDILMEIPSYLNGDDKVKVIVIKED